MRILNSQSLGAAGIGIGGQVLQKFQKEHRKGESESSIREGNNVQHA